MNRRIAHFSLVKGEVFFGGVDRRFTNQESLERYDWFEHDCEPEDCFFTFDAVGSTLVPLDKCVWLWKSQQPVKVWLQVGSFLDLSACKRCPAGGEILDF